MNAQLKIISEFYRQAFARFNKNAAPPEITVEFYPYIGINHTIRARDGKIFVRISDIFRDAPPAAQSALAVILVAKLLRKKIPAEARDVYAAHLKNADLREKALENKRRKGRKIVTSPQGDVYDLDEIFDRLNRFYFAGKIKKPLLSWSARKTFRRLGHHDSAHEAIIISKSLDDRKVPEFVVEFVVYHEMLHIWHPTRIENGRRYNHTPEFRRDEENFENFDEAEAWIANNSKFLKRTAKQSRID